MKDDLIDAVEGAVKRALNAHERSPWFDTEGAAGYLGCTPGTLKTWRARGEGPRYHIIHEKLVRYHVEQLDAFVRGEAQR